MLMRALRRTTASTGRKWISPLPRCWKIWNNADFESPEMEAHFKARYPLEKVRQWTKEEIINFALPYKCQIRRPKPPPSDAPRPKVQVTTSNMPEHMKVKEKQP